MKIAVCAQASGQEAAVDPRFGRCRYFVIVDGDGGTTESIENPAAAASGGAGIQAAQFLANQGIDAVLTGNVGPNAASVLQSSGVEVFTGVGGTVAETLARFETGELKRATSATVGPHHGGARSRRGR